jgi:methylase of polypeptide subunit release factors
VTTHPIEALRTEVPLRFGDRDRFAALRALLLAAEFTESGVCARTGVPSIYEFQSIHDGRQRTQVADARDVLIRLFLDAELVDGAVIERHLGGDGERLLDDLGLLRPPAGAPGARCATVLLYPTEGLWLVSDLTATGAGATGQLAPDAVYPAITDNTRDFLGAIPTTPCTRCLEMCGGTGVAALLAARHAPAGHAWTADITERATRFAEFNALLNDLRNVTAVQGDLYEPVRGLTFDRIVAHPPYVPTPERTMIYRDGGPDGEQVTRAILAGLPEFLEPGGRFYLTCIATDRTDAPLEQRIRDMIGPTQAEYDVMVGVRLEIAPGDHYASLAQAGESTHAEAAQRASECDAMGVVKMVYHSAVVERHAVPRAPITLRRAVGARRRVGEALDWQLEWERLRSSPGFDDRLLRSRIRCRDGLRVITEQELGSGGWRVSRCELAVDGPLPTRVACPTEMAAILMRCDGTTTVRDLARVLVDEGLVAADGAEAATVSFVSFFIGAGCLESDAVPTVARES